jgi:release factor glutamine methyltransferase
VERPKMESETLLLHILKKDRIYLILNSGDFLSEREKIEYLNYLQRRREREPIEYITNRVSFYSQYFFVDRGVLIPRPETELLIDRVVEIGEELDSPEILEIGVGSGVISLMLGKLLPEASILGVDISEEALKIADTNLKEMNLLNVEFQQSDLFSSVENPNRFQIIVSNPPYISDSEQGKLQRELDYEPDIALYGGEVGDEVLRRIIDQFFQIEAKYLLCEMGYDQREKIERYVDNRGKLEFYRDLAGLDRGFILNKF